MDEGGLLDVGHDEVVVELVCAGGHRRGGSRRQRVEAVNGRDEGGAYLGG